MFDPDLPAYEYSIDAADRIRFVSDTWMAFALENEASELSREALLGCSIWQYIAGRETRAFYKLLFAEARADRRQRVVPFRCDSPTQERFMEMRVTADAERFIHFTSLVTRQRSRAYCPLFDPHLERSDVHHAGCSLCLRVKCGDQWLDAEIASRRLPPFPPNEPPRLDYTVCGDCRDTSFVGVRL